MLPFVVISIILMVIGVGGTFMAVKVAPWKSVSIILIVVVVLAVFLARLAFYGMQIGIGLIGGFSTPVISGIFTATGTFGSSIMFGIGICVVAGILLALAMANKKKLQEKYWED